MNIKEAKQELLQTIQVYTRKDSNGHYLLPSVRQRPILLIGPPGIGKTAIMEQAARECGIGLVAYTITHHTRQSAVGLPVIVKKNFQGKEYSITEYTMSEIIASVYEKMEQTSCKEGILFIDEINCVSETLVPTMLQFLQNKTFGTHPVPEGWIIAAAGNPVEYNRSAREFDIVTLDRVKRIDIEPDLDIWKEYAYAKGLHASVISYLNLKKEHFYHIENTAAGVSFVTARGWEDLSSILFGYEELGLTPDEKLIRQYIQDDDIARDFAAYYQLYAKYRKDYPITELLAGNLSEKEFQSVCGMASSAPSDEQLSVSGLLLDSRETDESEKTARILEECLTEARKKRLNAPEEIIDVLREALSRSATIRKDLAQKTSHALEQGFAFAKAAFHDGPELLFLISDLSHNIYAMSFIRTFGCEEYFIFSEKLQFQRERAELLQQIDSAVLNSPG